MSLSIISLTAETAGAVDDDENVVVKALTRHRLSKMRVSMLMREIF
jgi:hypothetical protein